MKLASFSGFLIILALIVCVSGYESENVETYFQKLDTDSDGILYRREWEEKLQEEDEVMGIEERMEYYA